MQVSSSSSREHLLLQHIIQQTRRLSSGNWVPSFLQRHFNKRTAVLLPAILAGSLCHPHHNWVCIILHLCGSEWPWSKSELDANIFCSPAAFPSPSIHGELNSAPSQQTPWKTLRLQIDSCYATAKRMQAFKKAASKIFWHGDEVLKASPQTICDTLQGYLRREQAQQELAVGKRRPLKRL